MNYAQLLEDVKQEITSFYYSHDEPGYTYHNLAHTQQVVANATQIAQHYKLDDRDFFIVATAAWFHDIGYYIGSAADHEQHGADAAETFLQGKEVEEDIINAVKQCILATRIPQSPVNLLEQIVCDADLFHLGTDDFTDQNKKMRREMEWRNGSAIGKKEWRLNALKLLETHHYYTDYAQEQLNQKKKAHIDELHQKDRDAEKKAKVKGKKQKSGGESFSPVIHSAKEEAPKPTIIEKRKKNPDRPERGIETMFRISSANHQRLSDMADNKANIMITTTSIILSVLLSVMLRKLEDNKHLIFPTILLLTVCVTTMICAILATRPTLPGGQFTQSDLDAKKVNLLFFGNFYKMNYEDYDNGMQQVMNDRSFLYGTLTRDVYSQGIVLGRKYRYLRTAYNVFMYGVSISTLAYVIAASFFNH